MFICILFFYMLVFITTPQVVSFPRGHARFTAPRRPLNFPLMHGGNHSGFFLATLPRAQEIKNLNNFIQKTRNQYENSSI